MAGFLLVGVESAEKGGRVGAVSVEDIELTSEPPLQAGWKGARFPAKSHFSSSSRMDAV